MTDAADANADQLFTVAPEAFVAARNELVKRLRAGKRRDEAALVAGLRRPSAAAWALNQVARQSPGLVEAALDAGHRLRDATEAAVGGDAASLRQAAADDRTATDALVEAAVRLLGRDEARRTMASTVRAAVLDDTVADELRRGVLTADHEAAGFGFGGLGGGLGGDIPTPDAHAEPARGHSTARRAAKVKAKPAAPERPKAASSDTPAEVERVERVAQKEAAARQREERRQQSQRETEAARLAKRAARLSRAADEAEARAQEARREADAATAKADAARRALG